jgi:hypothetical protein
MRKLLWGAAGALAILAPAAAHADTTGHVDINYGNDDLNKGWDNFETYSLGGAVQTDFAPGWTVQLDANTVMQNWQDSPYDDSHSYAALHVDTTLNTFDVGGWIGLLNWYDDAATMVGVEGRTSFDNFSVQGSIGYAHFNSYNDYSAYDIRVAGSYFINPNWAVRASAVGTWFNASGYDTDATDFSIGTAYQFEHCPVSLSLDYTRSHDDPDGYSDYDGNVFKLGVHWAFGGGTLQDNTNHGASWGGAEALEDSFTRWDY